MPTFSSAQVTDPFLSTNELLAPMLAYAERDSKLGTLDINRQRLGLEYQKLAQQREAGAALLGGGDSAGTGTTGASTGGGGPFLDALANIESGDKNIISGVDKDSQGLTLAQGGNPSEISQGHFQIQTATWRDFAKQAGVDVNQYPTAMSAPREVQAQVASVIPLSRFGPRTQILLRTRFGLLDTNQTVGALAGTPALTFAPGTAGPRAATAPPPPFNPYAGPRVAGAPPAGAPGAAPVAAPEATPPQPGFGALTPVPGAPTVTGQADPASMEAVKKASIALLAMPEADAAVAYGPTVKALQAQGLAMNAPPVYPGHAALQAIVGQADAPVPVAPSRIALRLGGTDTAGPGAGPDTTLPPVAQPNRLYETGLPGIQITGPGNALAPPMAATPATPPPAPVTPPAGAAPPGRPVVPPPPVAPSRVIGQEPLIQSGPAAGLTDGQRRIAAAMVAGGTPVADVGAHMAQWRQLNVANQQQAATNAALTAQAQFERFKYEQEQKIAAEQTAYTRQRQAQDVWEDLGNGMERNKLTGETKFGGGPAPRFGPPTIGPDGKPAIPVMGGSGGTQFLPIPDRPATAGYDAQKEAYKEDQPEIRQAADAVQHARTSQIRWQTMLDLADKITTGAGGATRAQLANLAETAGFPGVAQTLIAHNSEGDAAAAQEFTKLATQAAGADARADLGSRAGIGAIRLFQSANPNLDLRPGANKNIIGMQLIAAQADADYNAAKLAHANTQQDSFFKGGAYQPVSRFEQQWQTQRNPQVYAAAMGALSGQPPSTWAKGLSDDEVQARARCGLARLAVRHGQREIGAPLDAAAGRSGIERWHTGIGQNASRGGCVAGGHAIHDA